MKFRPSYEKSLGTYFATYQVRERGIKKWIEKARTDWLTGGRPESGPEFPPLDQPGSMLDWWMRHMTNQASDVLQGLAQSGAAPAVTSPPPPTDAASSTTAGLPPTPPATPPPPPQPTRTGIDVEAMEGVDLFSAVKRQRKLLAATLLEYERALGDPNASESTISMKARRADIATERLRKIEDSLAATEKSRGHLIHIDDLRSELGPVLCTLTASLPTELTEKLGIDRARAVVFADNWFSLLRDSRFLDGLVPRLTPSTAAT